MEKSRAQRNDSMLDLVLPIMRVAGGWVNRRGVKGVSACTSYIPEPKTSLSLGEK